MNLLVVEDDPVVGKSLRLGFEESGHACTWAKDGLRGAELAMSQQFDAVILDILLPGKSGMEVLRSVRTAGIRTPVILLTALGSVDERVNGLTAGADDYMVKPFAFSELNARLEAIVRRAHDRPSPALDVGDLRLDLTTRRVSRNQVEIELTPTEFSLLEFLMRHAGHPVTRRMLSEHLWDADWDGATNVIEVHINRLRGKLERAGKAQLIHTIRGRGYAIRASAELES